MKIHNIISLSGGKDSTATAILAIAKETENLSFVFADTGLEHQITYDYLSYLENSLNIKIKSVKADFAERIAKKAEKLRNGELKGWNALMIEKALSVMKPTGIPFLDLCIWKGRFPSSQTQFCTHELKRDPIIEQAFFPIMDSGEIVYSWQGVRREESRRRRYVKSFEEVSYNSLYNYRPIAAWTVESVFEAIKYYGLEPNPLYKMGMNRVGCMPCINARKSEVNEIAKRFPEMIDMIESWEEIVSYASKRGSSTFFTATDDPTVKKSDDIHFQTHGIRRKVEWAKTGRGGRNMDLIASSADYEACSSAYGLCE